jgi:UDP-N-acetylmuramoyl-L-alanyl-D-glutamate--2,6-diaminopimelate ligase
VRLSGLLKDVVWRGPAGFDPEVSAVTLDSRRAGAGSVFFALPGLKADGGEFAGAAVAAGAPVVVSEHPLPGLGHLNVIVPDARLAVAIAASNLYGRPCGEMKVAGVTGTNGKTTVTYVLESIVAASGGGCGVIGTVEYRYAGQRFEASHTTPESVEIAALLARMRDAGVGTAVMEVSSHALAMSRVAGLSFDAVGFTNLTRDHLDYHRDMEGYFDAKARLFRASPIGGKTPKAVINIDDTFGMRLAALTRFPVIACSATPGGGADLYPVRSSISLDGIRAELMTPDGTLEIVSAMVGAHNLMNILIAAGLAHAIGLGGHAIERGVASLAGVPGRLERVENDRGVTCLVDYAHTDDALRNVLAALRPLCSGRIITVFGCGGDRDRGKRPLMGLAAAELSDLVVVTSDNPRTEEPSAIIGEILPGVRSSGRPELDMAGLSNASAGFSVVMDRAEAIPAAVAASRAGDVLLIAGKGHEDYQILGTVKRHYSDREEAGRAFAAGHGGTPGTPGTRKGPKQ